jgi:hypothetical protein
LIFSSQDDVAALGLGSCDINGGSTYNPSDVTTFLNTGACEVMRNHMQVLTFTKMLIVLIETVL